MATRFAGRPTGNGPFRQDQRFFIGYALVLATVIIVAFAQAALRGLADPIAAPWWVHLHAVIMLDWLALLIGQNLLAQSGNLSLHRKLGWLGLLLVAGIVVLGSWTGYMALKLHRAPPFFTPAYFLGLTNIGLVFFGAMVAWAIYLRRNTQWHRRLMLGATILLLEPAFGRLLPMPLLMPWGEAVTMLIQLGFTAIIMRHDAHTLGRIHPASKAIAAIIASSHAAFELFSRMPAAQSLASSIAAG